MNSTIQRFVRESNAIEGIHRDPTLEEIHIAIRFMELDKIELEDVLGVQSVFAPGKPIRDKSNMNVQVGSHVAPQGGILIVACLAELIEEINSGKMDPWKAHIYFEDLHPFMDGNGRTGRILWAWNMRKVGRNPFGLPFLHRFYYQTLDGYRPE